MKDISTYKSRLSSVKFSRKLELSQHEIVSSKNGRTYNNVSVRVTDLASGIESKRTSDMMFGTKAENVAIGYGEYVSEEEVEEALRNELEEVGNFAGSEVHYVNKKGEVQNIEDIINSVKLASGRIVIGDRNEKITNQNSANWGIEERGTGTYKKKGVAFLGNSGVELPKGGYVNRDELIKALEEYEIKIPEQPKVQEETIVRRTVVQEIEIPDFLKKYSRTYNTRPELNSRKIGKGKSDVDTLMEIAEKKRQEEQAAKEEERKAVQQMKEELDEALAAEDDIVNNPYFSIPTYTEEEVDKDLERMRADLSLEIERILGNKKNKKENGESQESTENEPQSFRIVRKEKSKIATFVTVSVIGLMATLASYGNSIYSQTVEAVVPQSTYESEMLETEASNEDAQYDTVLSATYSVTEESVIASLEDVIQNEIDEQFASFELGDSINVENGVNAYTSSSANKFKTIGDSGFFGSGTYSITGIAVTYEGQLLGFIENFDNSEELQGTNLSEFVKSICEKRNVSEDDVTVMVSLGKVDDGVVKCGSIGWVYRSDINNENTISGENLIDKTIETAEYVGTIDDFDGETITFENGETVEVVDSEGNYLDKIELDGRTYIINSLEVTESDVLAEDQETEQNIETELESEELTENTSKKSLKFNMLDVRNFFALPGLLGIAISKFIEKRKNKYNELHATFKKTNTKLEAETLREEISEYGEYDDYFEDEKEKKFKGFLESTLKSLFVKEDKWQVRKLSEDDLKDIEEIIKNESDYIESLMGDGRTFYDPEYGDKLDIADGEFVVINEATGRKEKLPIKVVKKISQIGKDNKLYTEGEGLPDFVEKPEYDDNWMGALKKVCNRVSKFSSSFINSVRDKLKLDAKDLKFFKREDDDDYYEKF